MKKNNNKKILKTAKGKRVLFFSAHPDDEIGSAGGFLAKTVAEGGKVHLALCVDPSEPRLDQSSEVERDIRLKEFNKAANSLGASSEFLNFPHYPALSYETILSCVRVVRSFRPDIIIVLQEDEYHTEHQLVAKIVKRAIWHAGRSAFPDQGAPHKTSFLWEAEGDRPLASPNHFEDITRFIKTKRRAFLSYGSQQARKNLADAFVGLNAFRGIMYKKGDFAECFRTTEFFYG